MNDYAIETSELCRSFGRTLAVDDLNLRVPSRCVYGFLGPNGAGKTTTIRMLLGLIHPDRGGVRLLGHSLLERRLSLLRCVGSLVEEPSLYPHLSGAENMDIARRLTGRGTAEVRWALETVHLDAVGGRLVRHYSQGMRQRLGLAMALLGQPELLILDEPTNGLDPAGIHEMRDLVRRLPEEHGTTVFISSHLLSEVEQMASHIGIINDGRLLFQGTLADLREQTQQELSIGVSRPELAEALLRRGGWIARHTGDHTLAVVAGDRAEAAKVNEVLVKEGIEVYHLSLTAPTLEETFLRLTGRTEQAA
ncbi:MAG: ABC transporter ATP-binding protein [Anaerolineae bacterium]